MALSNADTRVDPRGAMRSVSKIQTIVCVHIRPMCVMRNPEIDILPLSVSYHGISLELCTPLLASYESIISKPAFCMQSMITSGATSVGRPLPTSIPSFMRT